MVFLGHYAVQNIIISEPSGEIHFRSLFKLFQYISFFFPGFVISSYILLYIISPAYLYTRKITLFILCFTGLLIVDFITACFAEILYIRTTQQIPYSQITLSQIKFNLFVNGIWIPLIVLTLTCGIQMTKKWILQQTMNEKLVKDKISKELKLLKTRIHPRFLFHSLNSLESKLRTGLPESPTLILKMSELLNYVLFGSEGDYVLLEKELEVIREYIDLQKVNHYDNIQISLEINDETDDSYLAPLILLPFLETSFEYLMVMDSTAKNLDVRIRAREGILYFSLTCTEDNPSGAKFYQQPIWSDITRRVENLYPGNHQLILKSNDREIVIDLQLNMIHNLSNAEKSREFLKEGHEYA